MRSFYTTLEDDQFDFHSYCLRKVNLRAYIKCVASDQSLSLPLSSCPFLPPLSVSPIARLFLTLMCAVLVLFPFAPQDAAL